MEGCYEKIMLFTGATGFIGSHRDKTDVRWTRTTMRGTSEKRSCVRRARFAQLLLADTLMDYEEGPSFYTSKYSVVESISLAYQS